MTCDLGPSVSELCALVRNRINAHLGVHQRFLSQADAVGEVASLLIRAYREGNKAIFFGNGGSAADAQHLAAELVGKFQRDRAALPSVALTVNSSILTAIANDYSYSMVFARQVEALGRPGDIAIGLSTSGNSVNVLEAFRAAKKRGMTTVALTGETGGRLKAEVDYCIRVPSSDTPRVQEGHILVGHILCELIEAALFAGRSDGPA